MLKREHRRWSVAVLICRSLKKGKGIKDKEDEEASVTLQYLGFIASLASQWRFEQKFVSRITDMNTCYAIQAASQD